MDQSEDDSDDQMADGALGFRSPTDGAWDLQDMQMPPWAVKLEKRISVLEKLLKPKRERPQAN